MSATSARPWHVDADIMFPKDAATAKTLESFVSATREHWDTYERLCQTSGEYRRFHETHGTARLTDYYDTICYMLAHRLSRGAYTLKQCLSIVQRWPERTTDEEIRHLTLTSTLDLPLSSITHVLSPSPFLYPLLEPPVPASHAGPQRLDRVSAVIPAEQERSQSQSHRQRESRSYARDTTSRGGSWEAWGVYGRQ